MCKHAHREGYTSTVDLADKLGNTPSRSGTVAVLGSEGAEGSHTVDGLRIW